MLHDNEPEITIFLTKRAIKWKDKRTYPLNLNEKPSLINTSVQCEQE